MKGQTEEKLSCLGDCSAFKNCNEACIAKGYILGGYCLGLSVKELTCCCSRAI